MARRPPDPSDLRRSVLIEAGHRCAIPTCRQVPVEIAHIVAWSICRKHRFDNLIALCPTCHACNDKGEIDEKSMFAYKSNLSAFNGRYGDPERRLLKLFARDPDRADVWVLDSMEILLMYLLEDGVLEPTGLKQEVPGGVLSKKQYRLTARGREDIGRWFPPEKGDP